jgi:hypothetical protein
MSLQFVVRFPAILATLFIGTSCRCLHLEYILAPIWLGNAQYPGVETAFKVNKS